MKHTLLLNRSPSIALVGAGGTGSQMLTGLARMVYALREIRGMDIPVTVYDPDAVSPANVGRQLFSPSDIGLNKARVLVQRINAYFGFQWEAKAQRFEKPDSSTSITVSCVDTRQARADIQDILRNQTGYWMDLGNTNHSGQVILGNSDYARSSWQRRRKYTLLPTVADLFPDIVDTSIPDTEDTPSCSLAHALQKQDLMVNQTVATHALELLWQLLRNGEITTHGVFFDTQRFTMRAMPVDPEAWRRLIQQAKKQKAA